MQTLQDSDGQTELAAHRRRVAELCRGTARDGLVTGDLLWACRDFDVAVEFAAYEGMSLPEAIGEFLNEVSPQLDPGILEALRRVAQPTPNPALTGSLPVLPSAASKLMRMSPEGASVGELESVAATDPALAARLLSVANSALFSRGAEIRSLRQAVLRLGIPITRKTLLSACFGNLFASASLSEIQKHSQNVAALAYELAYECGADSEFAYLAGLVHDIGRLLTQRSPAELQSEVNRLKAAGFPLVYAETLTFGVDHAVLGGELLKDWHLPKEIVEAVTFQHRPESTESPLAGILCLAEEESRTAGMPSESLSAGLRRAAAARIAGLPQIPRSGSHRASPVFALAV